MDKKQFAIEQIKEYILDPSKCGYDSNTQQCLNLTADGKMCVAGKNYICSVLSNHPWNAIIEILSFYDFDQSKVFKPGVIDILTTKEWNWLQGIHDIIAKGRLDYTYLFDDPEALFTKEELLALRNTN